MTEDRRHFDPWAPPPPATTPTGVTTPVTAEPARRELPAGLDQMKKDDLVALAAEFGVSPDGTRSDIIARLKAL